MISNLEEHPLDCFVVMSSRIHLRKNLHGHRFNPSECRSDLRVLQALDDRRHIRIIQRRSEVDHQALLWTDGKDV